ncbi:MAG: dTDP-4-dehydrorhamnose 3,5-epimerase [Planctomycetes bacterium]|nr:dTDP-4-dehydrorhamnose 3,5-epimerase [Planctomycetota bacterium]
MKFIPTELPGLVIVEPQVFGDDRGFFMETFQRPKFAAAGIDVEFVQDNHSSSRRGVLRGLHYQLTRPQGKLVRAVRGAIFDVGIDLRRSSPTFGKWFGLELSEANRRQLYVPPGFAHGFCVISDAAEVIYKCTDVWVPQDERTVLWNDPTLAVKWPVESPTISAKDANGVRFEQADCFA